MNETKMLETLNAIKALWDVAGLGDDPEESERVYRMLNDRIAELEKSNPVPKPFRLSKTWAMKRKGTR